MFVIKNQKPLVFSANSYQEKTEWMNEITYAINQWNTSKKTLKLSLQSEDIQTLIQTQSKSDLLGSTTSARSSKEFKIEHEEQEESEEGVYNQAKKKFKNFLHKKEKHSSFDAPELASQFPSVPTNPSFPSTPVFPSFPATPPLPQSGSFSSLSNNIPLKPTRLAQILTSYEKVILFQIN